MYKYLDKKRIFQIKKIEKQFFHISKIISSKDNNYNWWLHEISRLDFRPWGGLNTKNFLENKPLNSLFIRRFIKDLINIIFFVLRGFFLKPRKISYKNIFISEKIILTRNIKNFYFNGIYNNIKSKFKIIASISKVSDKNAIDLNLLVGFNDKLKILFKSLLSEIKLFFFLRKLIKQKKIDQFWIDYFYIKESLKNIYINLIVYKFFVNNNFCKNIIFPYEEKTLERSIMLALNNKNKKTKSFALCINPQHNLSSFLKKFDGLDIPRTDKYLYCGKLYRNYFNKLGRLNILSTNKKDCIGSLKSRITNIKLNKNRNFLVLLSHINEYYELARYMKKEKKLLEYDFILRPYPHSED